jgi:GNAT superfamily N-acetyltransferase
METMTYESSPIDLLELARGEEARQARGVATVADVVEQIAGGVMCYAGAGSWANQAIGLGMQTEVARADIDQLIEFYASRGVEPMLEVCPFADPSLIRRLGEGGFVIREFENVLAIDLQTARLPAMPAGVAVVRLDATDAEQVKRCIAIKIAGFEPSDESAFVRMDQRVIAHPINRSYFAMVNGEHVAAGACDVQPPVSGLFGMATLPAFRRRGCQRALMLARLQDARDAGCRFATIGSSPLIATGRNAMRLGFQVAYTKVLMVKPGSGLRASM